MRYLNKNFSFFLPPRRREGGSLPEEFILGRNTELKLGLPRWRLGARAWVRGFSGQAAKPVICGLPVPVTKVPGRDCSRALIKNEQRSLEPQLGPPADRETLPQMWALVVGAPCSSRMFQQRHFHYGRSLWREDSGWQRKGSFDDDFFFFFATAILVHSGGERE